MAFSHTAYQLKHHPHDDDRTQCIYYETSVSDNCDRLKCSMDNNYNTSIVGIHCNRFSAVYLYGNVEYYDYRDILWYHTTTICNKLRHTIYESTT